MYKIYLQDLLNIQKKTQYALAKETGISNNAINKICSGDTQSVRLDTLYKICTALNCQIGDLIQDDRFPFKAPTSGNQNINIDNINETLQKAVESATFAEKLVESVCQILEDEFNIHKSKDDAD